MKNFPLISAIIPVFNRPLVVKRAIDSVLKQSFKDFEIVVVDDGSTDETPSVLKSYGSLIKVVTTENRGVSAARNKAVEKSSGKYIALLDSDDEWKKDKLSKQINHLIQNNYRITQTEEIWIRDGKFKNKTKKYIKPVGDIFLPSLDICTVSPSTVMMEKSLYEEYGGFDETMPVCEDYDLWLRMSLKENFGLLNEPLTIKYGGHEDQLSLTVALDKYRIISLAKILSSNSQLTEFQKTELVKALTKKVKIYASGAKKRENFENALWAEEILKKTTFPSLLQELEQQ
ncbi:MAG: glycosyltransferase family 2 protein [bacterium]